MRDLKQPSVLWKKAVLFLVIGLGGLALLLIELGTVRGAILLGVTIWAFCRVYYFAFYVIEKYVDPTYRFSGLFSFAAYAMRKRKGDPD